MGPAGSALSAQPRALQAAIEHVRSLGIQAVLFDMDGVIVDSIEPHLRAWNQILAEDGLPPLGVKTYLQVVGTTNRGILFRQLEKLGLELTADQKRRLIDRKEERLRTIMRAEARPTPGVVTWLEYLRRKGIRCAVASSGEMANIVTILESLRLAKYFMALVSAADLPASKPDPQIFLLAAAAVGVPPEHCLAVEDAPSGVKAAKAAGMAACALSITVPASELREADLLLENLAALQPESLFGVG